MRVLSGSVASCHTESNLDESGGFVGWESLCDDARCAVLFRSRTVLGFMAKLALAELSRIPVCLYQGNAHAGMVALCHRYLRTHVDDSAILIVPSCTFCRCAVCACFVR